MGGLGNYILLCPLWVHYQAQAFVQFRGRVAVGLFLVLIFFFENVGSLLRSPTHPTISAHRGSAGWVPYCWCHGGSNKMFALIFLVLASQSVGGSIWVCTVRCVKRRLFGTRFPHWPREL